MYGGGWVGVGTDGLEDAKCVSVRTDVLMDG